MRTGEETSYHFDLKDHMRKGHDFRDYICPDVYENNSDYFKVGNRFGRVLLLRDYASYISDDMVAEITDLSRNLMLSIDVVPIPTDEAVKEVEQRPEDDVRGADTRAYRRQQEAARQRYGGDP